MVFGGVVTWSAHLENLLTCPHLPVWVHSKENGRPRQQVGCGLFACKEKALALFHHVIHCDIGHVHVHVRCLTLHLSIFLMHFLPSLFTLTIAFFLLFFNPLPLSVLYIQISLIISFLRNGILPLQYLDLSTFTLYNWSWKVQNCVPHEGPLGKGHG